MKSYLMVMLIALLVGSVSLVDAEKESEEKTAEKAAQTWMALLDSGQFEKSYEHLGAETQKTMTRENWVTYLDKTRKPLGQISSRKLIKTEDEKSTTAAVNKSVVLRYESSYRNQKPIVEEFAVMQEPDGNWRVITWLPLQDQEKKHSLNQHDPIKR
jgi:hypothetical protein